jgi:hypothetical protein
VRSRSQLGSDWIFGSIYDDQRMLYLDCQRPVMSNIRRASPSNNAVSTAASRADDPSLLFNGNDCSDACPSGNGTRRFENLTIEASADYEKADYDLPKSMPRRLPISRANARKATNWLMTHFGGTIRSATDGTPFSPALLCAIACQETAYFWLPIVKKAGGKISPDEIVARCVLDASGDAPNAPRRAFPRNSAAFRARYDRSFAEMLVAEANATRAVRGFGPKNWIYKGYGIFQYDLQFVIEDEAYFRLRQWYDFGVCVKRVIKELTAIYARNKGNLWQTVRAYNGAGLAARNYRDNVKEFNIEAQAEIESMEAARPVGKIGGRRRARSKRQGDRPVGDLASSSRKSKGTKR